MRDRLLAALRSVRHRADRAPGGRETNSIDRLLAAIADPAKDRHTITRLYAARIRELADEDTGCRWPDVDQAIRDRWNLGTLVYIRERAWHEAQVPDVDLLIAEARDYLEAERPASPNLIARLVEALEVVRR